MTADPTLSVEEIVAHYRHAIQGGLIDLREGLEGAVKDAMNLQSLRPASASASGSIHGPWSHWTEPHCCGCWVISVENAGPVAKCNECSLTVDLLKLLEEHTMRLSHDVSMPFSGSMERKI